MATRKSARISECVKKQEIVYRKSAILSPHGELRASLLEASLDVKENIPASKKPQDQPEEVSSRKRRGTKEGPPAKRASNEKKREVDESTYSDSTTSSSSSSSESSRRRARPLPVMLEEEEVFEERHEMVRELREHESLSEFEDENDEHARGDIYEQVVVEERTDPESEPLVKKDERSIENESFKFSRKHMDIDEHLVPAPAALTIGKCEGIGSPVKVWSLMVKRDDLPRATACLLENHPDMKVSMRELLVDWIMEVCDSEKLHRETFHLAIDYLDRYLENSNDPAGQNNFQLIGTAALFIAAKYEEIYPPKCCDFANLTDGAFTASQIRDMEIILTHTIDWNLSPITSVHWLSTYMQLLGTPKMESDEHCEETNMYVPEMLRSEFMELCKVLDYLLFDLDSFKFSYRSLAAAVLFCTYEPRSAIENATGLSYNQLLQVIRFVRPVCNVFNKMRDPGETIPVTHNIRDDDAHNLQPHFKFAEIDELVKKERARLESTPQRRRHVTRHH